jgi:hypothetical protein
MKNPSLRDGLLGLLTEAFRKLPDLAVIIGAMVVLFFILVIMLMWSWAH